MLKKWIEEIRSNQNLYKSECWKYHISGNVLELSILPIYQKKKELYRCSVISVGQVLMALSKKIEEQHLNFHIQSFPSLENPEIVATIRTDEKGNFTNFARSSEKKFNKRQDLKTTLNDLVERHQFSMRKVENFSEIDIQDEVALEDFDSWYVISSAHNNPFTWLNAGYLKESLRRNNSDLSSNCLGIFDFCSHNKTHPPYLQVSDNEYVQFLVGIQFINASTK